VRTRTGRLYKGPGSSGSNRGPRPRTRNRVWPRGVRRTDRGWPGVEVWGHPLSVSGSTVARIACELIIRPSAQPSLLGNHTLEAE
jgi:uncharacterized protein YeaO (DUF488 family)